MLNKITLTVLVVGFWLLLSGHYTPLFFGFMLLSTAIVVYLSARMGADQYQINPFVKLLQILRFLAWFVIEIFKSNVEVALSVWGLRPVKPAMREVSYSQSTGSGAALYANAITLTPGTLSMDIDEDKQTILVHALRPEMLDDLDEGQMDQGISLLEKE